MYKYLNATYELVDVNVSEIVQDTGTQGSLGVIAESQGPETGFRRISRQSR
jgi:hypothetical protein